MESLTSGSPRPKPAERASNAAGVEKGSEHVGLGRTFMVLIQMDGGYAEWVFAKKRKEKRKEKEEDKAEGEDMSWVRERVRRRRVYAYTD